MTNLPTARITPKGETRWAKGHPWIYRSDVTDEPGVAGLCRVTDRRGKFLGVALYSPKSEIRLRLLSQQDVVPDLSWWRDRLSHCLSRRERIDATACRLVHGEGDRLPSLVVDRYDRWLV